MKKQALSLKSRDTSKANAKTKITGEDETAARPVKVIRKESSAGTTDTLRPTALEALTEEAVNKGTELYNYDTAINNAREMMKREGGEEAFYKLVSWNVAGLRAILKSGYEGSELEKMILEEKPDVLCLQETKLSALHSKEPLSSSVVPDYTFVECISSVKKGYSGTRTYLKNGVFDASKSAHYFDFDMSHPNCVKSMDPEGRVCASVLQPFNGDKDPICIVNTYVPNAGQKLERLDYRIMDFDKIMRDTLKNRCPAAIKTITNGVPPQDNNIIWIGDLNVAERNYDRFYNNFKTMQMSAGFTPVERESFRNTLKECGMVDSFREHYPNHRGAFTFYSYMMNQRAKGNGWRLDYFIASAGLRNKGRLAASAILNGYKKSDHIPSVLWLRK